MEINISKINADDYYIFYGGKTKLADYYVERLQDMGGILSASAGDEHLGYIIYRLRGNDAMTIEYIFVTDLYRRRQIAGRLLASAETLGESRGKIYIGLSEKIVGFEYLYDFLIKRGYIIDDKMYLFRGDSDDFPSWDSYMEKHGSRIVRWLTDVEGYGTASFDEIDENTIKDIIESEINSREPYLMTPFLNGSHSDFIPSMSFAAFKRGENIPVAHCIVTGPDEISVVFSQVSSLETNRHKGIVMLPFIMSLQSFRERGYKRSVYAVSEKNKTMLAFTNNVLSKITRHKTIQYNFMKKMKEN